MYNSISMTRFSATIANMLDVQAPEGADESIELASNLKQMKDVSKIDKVLIYNPDAIGMWLFQKYTEEFAPVLKHIQLTVPVRAVMPSVTPVCFGTMYTGVLPETHGITAYKKQLIERDSLFDSLARSGKKVALVATQGSSMSIIFGGRNIDYYIMKYDPEVNSKAHELIQQNMHDVIVVYNMEYDDAIHAKGPEALESLNAMKNHINAFSKLAEAVKIQWCDHTTLIVWATDHGIHEMDDGKGNHGSDMEEDLNVLHFYGIYPSAEHRREGE